MSLNSWESMTGFATAEETLQGKTYRAQLKSVNHKYFEMRVRAPRELFAGELLLRQKIRDSLQRGSLDLQIDRVEIPGVRTDEVESFKKKLMGTRARYAEAVAVLRPSLFERGALLAKIFDSDEKSSEAKSDGATPSEIESFAEALSKKLCQNLKVFRSTEGSGIQKALQGESFAIEKALNEFKKILPVLQDKWRVEMEKRIGEWAEKLKVAPPDRERIFQELVVILEKRDVAEEIQRIDSHLRALNLLIDGKEKVDGLGKRLDFIGQEFNREWTTLNNKVSDPEVSQSVAGAKLAIDRIREQGLNVL